MERAQKTSFYCFRSSPSFSELNKGLCSPPLSVLPHPPVMETQIKIKTQQFGLMLAMDSASVPPQEESPSSSTGERPKFKCTQCGKGFSTEKAMFGHMRIHRCRGSKVSKRTSIPKRKANEPIADHISDTDHHVPEKWGATKCRGWKPLLDKESPQVNAASILFFMTRSAESDQLDRKTYFCKTCKRTFPSRGAFLDHVTSCKCPKEEERKNANYAPEILTEQKIGGKQERARKKARGSGSHVCEICGKEYLTGQQLGGHKRAHYNKDLPF